MSVRLIHIAGSRLFLTLGASFVFLAQVGCQGEKKEQAPVETQAQAQAPKKEAPPAPQAAPKAPKGSALPIGPRLIVVPGKGAGAIRFGANFETVKRLMGAECDFETETRCGYVKQAIEFEMKEGVVARIKAYRRGREVAGATSEEQKYYGSFRGVVRPKLMLGLHRHVVIEEFGEPVSKSPLKGKEGQVERHEYDGIAFEYDKIENGNVVLSVIDVTPSKTAKEGVQSQPGAAAPSGSKKPD